MNDYTDNEKWQRDKFTLPYAEYLPVDVTLANVLNVFRMSLGDFDFVQIPSLTESEGQLYWLLFAIVLIISNVIFLNFIIAEAGSSYQKVKINLSALTQLERAVMINECETMIPFWWKDEIRFPKYIIIRTVEK